jgi:hypothetical protein
MWVLPPRFLFGLESYYFCELGALAKLQNTRTTPYVTRKERKKKNNPKNSGTLFSRICLHSAVLFNHSHLKICENKQRELHLFSGVNSMLRIPSFNILHKLLKKSVRAP